jgi:uncharacterized protein
VRYGHAIAAIFFIWMGAALAASFDCTRAASGPEKAVCADRELDAFDEYLGRYYAAARDAVKEAARCLQADQQEWLKNVRDHCETKDCLKAAYLDRLAELDALQPGATALKNVELPRRPALVWIVPPAADKVAAPPNPRATPFQSTGVIVDEIAQGDGIVLRDDAGRRHVLVMLMFLQGGTQQALQLMARQKGARFTVRGYLSDTKTVEPSRCLFIHRLSFGEGRILTDVGASHAGFRPYELPFALPTDAVARAEFRSEPFYAVILETFPPCFDTEPARLRVQAAYPGNKVFATRFGCEDGEPERIDYTNVARNRGFMAIFAGTGEEEAKAILEKVKQEGRFRGANLRKMQAVLVYP